MDIPSLSFTTRWQDITTKLFVDTMIAHPRLKFGLPIDGEHRPDRTKLGELCVGYDAVSQKVPAVDNIGCDVKLVLTGKATEEFFRTGACEDLTWVINHTVRPIYDAIQFEFPAHAIQHDPNLWLKSLCESPLPTVFRVDGPNRDLFDIAVKYRDVGAIPLQPLRWDMGDVRVPAPFPALPNGYGVDLFRTTPGEFESVLRLMDTVLPHDSAEFVWLDLTWGGAHDRIDLAGLLKAYYNEAARHFEKPL